MTLKKEVYNLLNSLPEARERRNRARAVWFVLHKIHGYEVLNKDSFVEVFSDINSINRLILWHQQHNKELRGNDYNDKVVLEQNQILSLGYQPGNNYYQKKLKKLN